MRNNFIKKTLKNGVKLYLYKDSKMKKTVVNYGVCYGSTGYYYDFYLDDKHYHVLPGCAHFLEHMLGEHSKYGNLYKRFAQKKYTCNAGTSDNYTHYYFIGIDDIYESIEELITAIDEPVFTEDDIKETSEAICEETKMTRDDKIKVGWKLCQRNLYSNVEIVTDTLNRLGDVNTTKSLNYEMLKACYDAYYNDENKYLMIAGNIDEEEIINHLESIYAKLKPHPNRRKDYVYPDNEEIRKDIQIEYMPVDDDFTVLGFKNKYNNKFTKKEIDYFSDFIFQSKFKSDSKFIEKMKKNNVISKVEFTITSFLPDHFDLFVGSSTKNSEEYVKKVRKEIMANNFKEKDFNLFMKKIIANEAFKIDYKYSVFTNFLLNIYTTDDFDDIDFVKGLTFERFLEFYRSLDFSKSSVSIIRNPNKRDN